VRPLHRVINRVDRPRSEKTFMADNVSLKPFLKHRTTFLLIFRYFKMPAVHFISAIFGINTWSRVNGETYLRFLCMLSARLQDQYNIEVKLDLRGHNYLYETVGWSIFSLFLQFYKFALNYFTHYLCVPHDVQHLNSVRRLTKRIHTPFIVQFFFLLE